jgi:hypothetical protein
VHNSQPWYFSNRESVIRLHSDPRRQLPQADPAGGEMVISCGAALFNLRLAMRRLGFAADVTLLPDPSRPDLLAEIRWGRHAPPTLGEVALYRSIRLRHTHRGYFTSEMPSTLALDLVRIARQEQAELSVIYDTDQRRWLGGLIQAAEYTERTSPGLAAERMRWARPPGDQRPDGVSPRTYPAQPDGLQFLTPRLRLRRRLGTCGGQPAGRPVRPGRGRAADHSGGPAAGLAARRAGTAGGCCCTPRPVGSVPRSTPSRSNCPGPGNGSAPSSLAARTPGCCCAWVAAVARPPPAPGRRRHAPRGKLLRAGVRLY